MGSHAGVKGLEAIQTMSSVEIPWRSFLHQGLKTPIRGTTPYNSYIHSKPIHRNSKTIHKDNAMVMRPRSKPPTSTAGPGSSSGGVRARSPPRSEAAETQRLLDAMREGTRAESWGHAATDRNRNGNQRSRRRAGRSLSTSHPPSAAGGQMTLPSGRVYNLRSSATQPVIRMRSEGVQSRRVRGGGTSALRSVARTGSSRRSALGNAEAQKNFPTELPMVGEASQAPLPLEYFGETDHDSSIASNIVEKGLLPTPNSNFVDKCTPETQIGSASEETIHSNFPPPLSVVIAKGDAKTAKAKKSGKGGKRFAKRLARLNRFYNSSKDNVEAWVPNLEDKEYYSWKEGTPDSPPKWRSGESLASVLTLPGSSGSEDEGGPANRSRTKGLKLDNRYEADGRERNPLLQGSDSGSDGRSDDTVRRGGDDVVYADRREQKPPVSQGRSMNLGGDDTSVGGYATVVAFNNAVVAAQRSAVGTRHMASHYQNEAIQREEEELESDPEEDSEESEDERAPTPSEPESLVGDKDEYWAEPSLSGNDFDVCQRCGSRYASVWLGGCRHWICESCVEACWWDQVQGQHHWPTSINCPRCGGTASWIYKGSAHGTALAYFVVNRSADAIKRLRNETRGLVDRQAMRQYIVRRFSFGVNEGNPDIS